jgi:O-antigen/teichoic acid export membrane protein
MSSVRSGAFSLGNHFINIIITIGSLSILGRLLSPEDFGLIGIILAIQTFFQSFLDLGLKPTFIKLPKIDRNISNVFFSVNFYLGIIFVIIICCLAPILVKIYREPKLLSLTIVFSISIIIQSLSLQRIAVLSRKKLFEKRMIVSITGLFLGTGIALVSALCGLGVWALVFKRIGSGLGQYFAVRWFVRDSYRLVGLEAIQQHKQKLYFGASVVVSDLIGNMLISVDKLIFGKFYSVDILGYYTQASRIAIVPDSNLRMSLSVPALAHLSRVEKIKNKENYLTMCTCILLIAGIPCTILIAIGDWVLPWLLGVQWVNAGIYMQILGLWGLGKVFHGLSHTMYLNEMLMQQWIRINIVSIPIILFIPIFLSLIGFGPIVFVVALSGIFFIYWTFILLKSLFKFTGSIKASRQILWSLSLNLITVLTIGYNIRYGFLNLATNNKNEGFIEIAYASVVIILSIALVQFMLNRNNTMSFYSFIRNRIK